MPGRKPKPTALKVLTGNPGKRALNKAEPKFGGSPKCPTWLSKEAKREWKRVTTELEALGMLTAVDSSSLAAYCLSFARWKSAEQIVETEGQTVNEPIVNKAGEVVGHRTKRHPATIIAKDEKQSMQKFAALFGFDPSSRSRLTVAPQPEKTKLEAILDGDSDNHEGEYIQ